MLVVASLAANQGQVEDDLMGQEFRHVRRLLRRTEQMMDEISQLIGPAGRLLETFSPSDSSANDIFPSGSFSVPPAPSPFPSLPASAPPPPSSFSAGQPVPVPSAPRLPSPAAASSLGSSLPDAKSNDFIPPPPPPAPIATSEASFIALPSPTFDTEPVGNFGDLSSPVIDFGSNTILPVPIPLPQFRPDRSIPLVSPQRPAYPIRQSAPPAAYRQVVHPQRHIPVAPPSRPVVYYSQSPSSPYKRSVPVHRPPLYSAIPPKDKRQ